MGNVSEAVTLVFGAVMMIAVGYEIKRRKKILREVYDVLDNETKHIAAELEEMISAGKLKPYSEETWA